MLYKFAENVFHNNSVVTIVGLDPDSKRQYHVANGEHDYWVSEDELKKLV